MTLIGLTWVAFLVNRPFVSSWLQPLTLLEANPYAYVQKDPQGPETPLPETPLSEADVIAYRTPPPHRQTFYPQLTGLSNASVNWDRWIATALVSVISDQEGANSQATQVLAARVAERGLCSAYTAYADAELGPEPLGTPGPSPENERFEVRVNQVTIGQVTSKALADKMANQIRATIPAIQANPEALLPRLGETVAAGQLEGKTVFDLAPPCPVLTTRL
ncbi:MAG: hypothetical protein HC922_06275 [Leptolyngbyaceae cyanobacterium SM2_3_12]|nr:hypothetical protein [Leptolyngbyaceae cyanobacterium SM2_3_12]